jgi:hypothetical protein
MKFWLLQLLLVAPPSLTINFFKKNQKSAMKSISLHPPILLQHPFLMSKSHYAHAKNLAIIDTIQLETLKIANSTGP